MKYILHNITTGKVIIMTFDDNRYETLGDLQVKTRIILRLTSNGSSCPLNNGPKLTLEYLNSR